MTLRRCIYCLTASTAVYTAIPTDAIPVTKGRSWQRTCRRRVCTMTQNTADKRGVTHSLGSAVGWAIFTTLRMSVLYSLLQCTLVPGTQHCLLVLLQITKIFEIEDPCPILACSRNQKLTNVFRCLRVGTLTGCPLRSSKD